MAPNGSETYAMNELLAYEVPNLLQEATATMTSDTSPHKASTNYAAENLVTNLENRSCRMDR